jgi:DNA-binding PadR family transcriptional regulator
MPGAPLFHTKWDPAVLSVLSEKPRRFLALVRAVRATVGGEILDGTVARSLDRLQQFGHVTTESVQFGERVVTVYCLTDRGREQLMAYQAIVAAYRQVQSGGDRPHGPSVEVAHMGRRD